MEKKIIIIIIIIKNNNNNNNSKAEGGWAITLKNPKPWSDKAKAVKQRKKWRKTQECTSNCES
jgi:hypothetical protein